MATAGARGGFICGMWSYTCRTELCDVGGEFAGCLELPGETCFEAKTKLIQGFVQQIMNNDIEIKKSILYKFYCSKMEEWKCAYERSARRFHPKVQELKLAISEKQVKGNETYCFNLHCVYSEMVERGLISPEFTLPGYNKTEVDKDESRFDVNDFD